ncbi:MAG: fibronectin type III domain-containing protein, partial [Chthoniobacterales bacterium]
MFSLPGPKRLLLGALIGALAVPIALAGVDDASRYTGTNAPAGWISGGHRGDIDFGFWEFEAAANGGSAGRFLGDSSLVGADANINTGGQAFGLFAHPPQGTAPVAAAIRKFAKPTLTTGDTLSFQLAVNFRNGTKGFTLRNATGTSQWNFSVGRVDGTNDGYYIRNGVSGSAFDNGQRFGGYSANTVFTFTFTQRERQLQWTAVRSGGISATVSGSLAIDSGTIADLRFFITGTDPSGEAPWNNLYFNNLSLVTESRGDAPLTIGERRTPGVVPSHFLRFTDPNATNVTVRHSGDWNTGHIMTRSNSVWSIDVRNVPTASNNPIPLASGWHEFKFHTNSAWEAGDNRWLYINASNQVAAPPAVYLTWQRDPTTTMTVHWHNFSTGQNTLRYRLAGSGAAWTTLTATTTNAPVGERLVRIAEITGLNPGWIYEFQVDGYTETFRFKTMPADLTQPVKFAAAGDADIGPDADAMAAAIAARDPAFVAMIGDHAYEDSRAANFWMWERYLQSYFTNLRAPDGRLIPIVSAVGNHEIYNGWGEFHPDFENTADWRLRYGSYFFRYFAFPGANQPYGVLDFG